MNNESGQQAMSIQVVTDFRELMRLSRALGQARKSGDPSAIARAQSAHDAYRDLCLKADRMALGVTQRELGRPC